MHISATPPQTQRPPLKRPSVQVGRWYLPLMVTIAVGFGIANYYKQSYTYQLQQEEERLRKNQQIMDAYGHKDNLHDIERALAVYEIQ